MTPGRLRPSFQESLQGVDSGRTSTVWPWSSAWPGRAQPPGRRCRGGRGSRRLDGFMFRVVRELPPLARVSACEVSGDRAPRAKTAFARSFRAGRKGRPAVHIHPIRHLPQCLAELYRSRPTAGIATPSSTARTADPDSPSSPASPTTAPTPPCRPSPCAIGAGGSTRTRGTAGSTPSRTPARSAVLP